jgi:hypothetical protein
MLPASANMTNSAQSTPPEPPVVEFWRVPWEFMVHALVGTLIFGIIGAAAVFIGLIVDWLSTHGISGIIIFGLRTAEYALFISDLALYFVFLWRTSQRMVQKL